MVLVFRHDKIDLCFVGSMAKNWSDYYEWATKVTTWNITVVLLTQIIGSSPGLCPSIREWQMRRMAQCRLWSSLCRSSRVPSSSSFCHYVNEECRAGFSVPFCFLGFQHFSSCSSYLDPPFEEYFLSTKQRAPIRADREQYSGLAC